MYVSLNYNDTGVINTTWSIHSSKIQHASIGKLSNCTKPYDRRKGQQLVVQASIKIHRPNIAPPHCSGNILLKETSVLPQHLSCFYKKKEEERCMKNVTSVYQHCRVCNTFICAWDSTCICVHMWHNGSKSCTVYVELMVVSNTTYSTLTVCVCAEMT